MEEVQLPLIGGHQGHMLVLAAREASHFSLTSTLGDVDISANNRPFKSL